LGKSLELSALNPFGQRIEQISQIFSFNPFNLLTKNQPPPNRTTQLWAVPLAEITPQRRRREARRDFLRVSVSLWQISNEPSALAKVNRGADRFAQRAKPRL
jgi:hypothetical protein